MLRHAANFLMMSIVCLAFFTFGGGGHIASSWARAFKVPCAKSFPVIYTLAQRLDQAESPRSWERVYAEVQEVLKILHSQRDVKQLNNDDQLACVHALALESALYLSDDPIKGRLWAMHSIGHAVSLSSLKPQALKTRKGRQWLKLALRRVKRASRHATRSSSKPKIGTHAPRIQFGDWRLVTVSAQEKPYQLSLELSDHEGWSVHCGLIKGCQEPLRWRVYHHRGKALQFLIPAARYLTHWSGPCAQTQKAIDIGEEKAQSGRLNSVELKAPSLQCYSSVKLIDQESDEQIELAESLTRGLLTFESDQGALSASVTQARGLPEGRSVKVSLSGYKVVNIDVPALGAPLELKLERCSRQIRFKVSPSDAQIEGPAQVVWGVSARFRISRPGYLNLNRSISLDRPKRCNLSVHHEFAELSRAVNVTAYNSEGLDTKLNELLIGGVPQDQSQVVRPVGNYRVEARAAHHQDLITTLKVPRCDASSCAPVKLELNLKPPPPPSPSTALRLSWLGGGASIAGLSLLGFAYQSQRHYDRHLNYTHDLNATRSRVRTLYGWGWGVLASGLVTTSLGWIWPALAGESEAERRVRP